MRLDNAPLERPDTPAEAAGVGSERSRSGVRRRGRKDRTRSRVLVRSAALGAFIALLVSGLLHIVIIGLAKGATPGGQVPAQMGLRLTYAWYTLSTAVTRLADQVIGALGYAPLIALAGAALGVLAYLAPTRLTRRRRGGRMRRRRS